MTLLKDAVIRWTRSTAVFLAFTAGVIVLLLWLAGKFERKIATDAATPPSPGATDRRVVEVRLVRHPVYETATGTISAVHETSIGSKVLARVVAVDLKAGQKVRSGEILVRLDDTDLQAKLQQAKAAVTAAEAVHRQAATDEQRYAGLVKTQSISQQQYDKALTALRSSEAELRRAQESVGEVQAMLDWTIIRAPMDGVVIDKKIGVGDTVTPGQTLLTLYDPKRMQLVASVRESLRDRLSVSQSIGVQIAGLGKQCEGTISEIVPEAQAASRSFLVKVTGPCPPGIYKGMFGRILVPLEEEELLVVPAAVVRKIGQLELVEVIENGQPMRRSIRTGRTLGSDVQVLSGLRAGERVVIPQGVEISQEAGHE